jgi:hypothetical protein
MEHDIWWPLRSALGETLTADEQSILDAAYREQDAAEANALKAERETLLSDIRANYERTAVLEAEVATLQKKRRSLNAKIRRAEAALAPHVRESLGLSPTL